MLEAARMQGSGVTLRVAILAPQSAFGRWKELVERLGHVVVEQDADVILADGEVKLPSARPAVHIGRRGSDALGHLSEDATPEQIDAALRAVAAGLVVASPDSNNGFRAAPEVNEKSLLTPRELEVLQAIAEGLPNKAIARRLDISLHTVKFHTESVFRKLGVRTRSEATARALERIHADRISI